MTRPRALLLAVASGLLTALALPQCLPWLSLRELDPAGHLEWLAWFSLVPALFALDRARSWRGALGLGLVAGLAYFYAAIWWVNHAMTSFGGVPLPLALIGLSLLVLYMAAHWALAFALAWLVRRRLGWPLWAHLPALWVGTELLRNYLFSGFPWANLGYLQARHLAVAQLAAITGVYGIAALLVLVNAVLLALLQAGLARAQLPWRPAVSVVVLLVAVVAFGELHLIDVRARAAAAPHLTVALVQGNVDQAVKNVGRSYGSYILGRYVPLTLEADRRERPGRLAGGGLSVPRCRRTSSRSPTHGSACPDSPARTSSSARGPMTSASTVPGGAWRRGRTACSCSAPTWRWWAATRSTTSSHSASTCRWRGSWAACCARWCRRWCSSGRVRSCGC